MTIATFLEQCQFSFGAAFTNPFISIKLFV